ncbi:hypothetical protein CAL65_22585 [Alkalilimnicola ehrlichii]|uniref:Uncharacterized protein n=1 Tax=Alkalilimnicola ehrlichii TaxID=351052 RepID=A0A3E0WEX7_9GAMM|nr:hypothetical protein CAL65_22585 [Alkalilimnicola ehrlichii]
MAIGGCKATVGLGCYTAIGAGSYLVSDGYSSGYANAQALLSAHEYQTGQQVIASFTEATHPGEATPTWDAVVSVSTDAALVVGGGLLASSMRQVDDLVDAGLQQLGQLGQWGRGKGGNGRTDQGNPSQGELSDSGSGPQGQGAAPSAGGGAGDVLKEGTFPDELFSKKAPKYIAPGTKTLEGQYINDRGRVEPWKAHYDDYGRQVGRTDYNAGNRAAEIPDTHYTRYEYDAKYPDGRQVDNHSPGEFPE